MTIISIGFYHGQSGGNAADELPSPLRQAAVHLDYDAHGEYEIFPFEGEGTKTVLLCGAFHFENPGDYPLLQCLPKVVHIPGEQGRMVQGFANIVSLITYESASRQAGAVVMLRRLTEMLFIQVIRVWIEQQAETTGGWLAAMRDQPISAALGLIHQFPERGWKVEELADAVALSRSEGKPVLVLIWDNASWHVSKLVRTWLRQHNQKVLQEAQTGKAGVRIIPPCWLPIKSPWLNRIESKWVHGKRAIVEPARLLTASEARQRVCDYFGFEPVEPLHNRFLEPALGLDWIRFYSSFATSPRRIIPP